MRSILLLILFLLPTAPSALAQTETDPMLTGILAFREARYQDAVDALETAIEVDGQNAEAHFLLARIFFETELDDARRAGRELDRALDIDPDNVQYLVARMQQLRSETRNFLSEKVREARRRELARTILDLDSLNAFAHEEMGTGYIRDFWRYRNALMYPTVTFNEYEYRNRQSIDPMAGYLVEAAQELDLQQGAGPTAPENEVPLPGTLNPNAVFLADEFDPDALERMGIPVVDLSGRAQRAYDRAIGHLNTALEVDPRNRNVYDLLMEVYTLKGEWADALNMLGQMYVFFPDDPDLWTYLGLAHFRFGNLDASAKAFESSFQYMPDDARAAYGDLEVLLSDEERRAYRDDPTTFTTRFWNSKDPRYLTPFNERKLEHYARLTYADLLYGAAGVGLRGWQTERGRILVRYGIPQGDVVVIPRSTSGINRSVDPQGGTASDPTGNVGLALQVGREGSDFSMLDEANTFNIWDYGDFKFVFEDPFRNGEYRMYSPSAADLSQGAVPWINDYTIKAEETFRQVPELYDYEAPGRQIELPYLVAAFKGSIGRTDLYVNYGIPINEFRDMGDMIDITANAGMFVVGAERDILAERRRTIYGLRTDQIVTFEEANLWIDSEELTVPPGEADVSVEFETTSGGTVAIQRRSVTVPDFDGDELSLSDILLAYRVEESPDNRPLAGSDIVRNGLSITPAPWSVFAHGRPIYLYYEVYNLSAGDDGWSDYEVEAALVPKETGSGVGRFVRGIFGGNDAGVSVSLPIRVAARDDGQYLILDADAQETGLYTIELRVRDRITGAETVRRQDLFLE